MRNHFTITISDVHGARHFSFRQFVRKFAWVMLVLVFTMWAVGAVSIWWLTHEAGEVEKQHKAAIEAFNDGLIQTRGDYEELLKEKQLLETDFEEKSAQVAFLDQTLQGLEQLVGVDADEPELIPYEERVKRVQLNSLGKTMMLDAVPSGPAVAEFKGITSKFGYRKHPVLGKRHMHGGLDYRGRKGDDVIATADGVVQYSSYSKSSGFGNLVTVIHDNGFKTRYGHLSKRSVKVGQYVHKGDKIGEIGNTGRSSGSHLHYEVWFLHHRLNPEPFHTWSIEKYDDIFAKVKGVPWGSLSLAIDNRVKRVEKQLSLRDVALVAK